MTALARLRPLARAAACFAFLSCNRGTTKMKDVPLMSHDGTSRSQVVSPAAQDDELDRHLGFLLSPFGDEPSRRQRAQSLAWLVAHGDRAYPRLLGTLRANPTALDAPPIMEALPAFGRPESVPVLAEILDRGLPQLSTVAALALARQPEPPARAALLRAVASANGESRMAALDGLKQRADRSVCAEVLAVLADADPSVRYHAVVAAAALGCLSKAQLAELSVKDPDRDVRSLAIQLAGAP
jgi:hypothetical protein